MPLVTRQDLKALVAYCDQQSTYAAMVCIVGGSVMLVPAYGYFFTTNTEIAISRSGESSIQSPRHRAINGTMDLLIGFSLLAMGSRTLLTKQRSRGKPLRGDGRGTPTPQ